MAKVVSLKTRPQGRRRSAEQWRELISVFQRSGETRTQFCARHGVPLSTFAWWQSRLRTDMPATAQPLFVELMPEPAAAPARRSAEALDLELDLGDGLVIRLRRSPC